MAGDENWRAIPGYKGAYEVSDQGRVRSLNRVTDRGRNWRGRMMTPSTMPSGYRSVTLWRDGKQKTELVHRLVLLAFVGPAPDGAEALHGKEGAACNSLDNLRWGTHADNQLDQVAHGTHANAQKETCPNGHPYDDENTYVYPGRNHRACRRCRSDNARKWKAAYPERASELGRASTRRYRVKKAAEVSK